MSERWKRRSTRRRNKRWCWSDVLRKEELRYVEHNMSFDAGTRKSRAAKSSTSCGSGGGCTITKIVSSLVQLCQGIYPKSMQFTDHFVALRGAGF
jgi:hypothetical protein